MLTLTGVLVFNSRSCAVMEAKVDNLTRQVEKHNRMAERAYALEQDVAVVKAGIEKLHWLAGRLMAKYGIGASGVIRHYDVTGKLCPAPCVAAPKWAALKAAITGGIVSGAAAQPSPEGSVAELAQAVIRGDYGNGAERKRRLGSPYDAVQARVSEILL